MKFCCSEGHTWSATPSHINGGKWCPKCGGTETLTLEEMYRIAKQRHGKCLSKKYVNSKTKLKWQCKEGHTWTAIPGSILRGSWCPKCGISKRAKSRRLTIEDMHKIAKERGGKCLAKSYVSTHTKILWQCSKNHKWEARPHDVKQGTWCPICANKRKGKRRKLRHK